METILKVARRLVVDSSFNMLEMPKRIIIITICFSTPIQKNTILHCIKALLCTVTALDENDLQVQKGDVVSLLNDEDPDWFWVSYSNGSGDVCQGFVPSNFTYKYEGSSKPLYCRFS